MKQYISKERADALASLARNHFDYYAFVFDLCNAVIADWIKSQGDVELPEPTYIYHPADAQGTDDLFEFSESGPVDESCPTCIRLYTKDQLLEVSAKYKARLAQCEAVLGQALDAMLTANAHSTDMQVREDLKPAINASNELVRRF